MLEHIAFYLNAHTNSSGWAPALRAALVCGVLYQLDLALMIGQWLANKLGFFDDPSTQQLGAHKSAMIVMPTLLRNEAELSGLMNAARSAAENDYPGPLTIVLCIDGCAERPDLFERLREWAGEWSERSGQLICVSGLPRRAGKAVAMESGVEHMRALVERGELPSMPELFFNMDADSRLGPRALERMAGRLARKRRLLGTPHMIVTSNVIVPFEQCYRGVSSLFRLETWLALLVAREYLSSITCAKFNWKLFPCTEVSGALYCTWTEVHLAAPYYASFMQELGLRDHLRWWFGLGPRRFSEFRGEPLPEAMSGPGDDTWIAWLAVTAHWENGRISFDAPATPLHAFVRVFAEYFSRAVSYDPLAKVYSKTPTTAKALFTQRLRWNSSRIQDLSRWLPSHLYHWHIGLPLVIATTGLMVCISGFMSGAFALALGFKLPPSALPFALLVGVGYSVTRVTSTLAGLLISESPAREWIKLIALPFAGPYHIAFNTVTLCIGYVRDILGFGEPTTFAPEETLRKSRLSRIALAYRARRAFFLALRAVLHGDIPFGRFWFGWRESPWTPSGFDGWSKPARPRPIHWPAREETPLEPPP